MHVTQTKPTQQAVLKKPGLGLRSSILAVLLIAPVPAFLAAEAGLDIAAGIVLALVALTMVFVILRM